MPRAPRACGEPGCPLAKPCPTHQPPRTQPAWWRPPDRRIDTGSSGQKALNARVLREKGDDCYLCGQPGCVAVDHVTPRYRGGTNDWDNLQPICGTCHSAKSSREGVEARALQRRRNQTHRPAVD